MTTIIEPPVRAPAHNDFALGSSTRPEASTTPEFASRTPAEASTTPADTEPDREPDVSKNVKIGLGIAAVAGAVVIGGIGFYLSFGNLSTAGHEVFGFPKDNAKAFAVGVDAAIITCLVLDLFMATIRTSWPLLRLLAHAMTAASVYFNAAAHGAISENVDKAVSHGLMPVLFVIGVEAGRRILVHQAALPADHDVIPGHRWVLAPRPTWRIFRMMKLWEVGYADAMTLQRERAIFNAWNEYKAELKKAGVQEGSEEALARLPRKLEPVGLTVDQALALPDRMAREELRRRQEADKRARQLELDKERAEHAATKERLVHRKELAALNADVAATEGVAEAEAQGAVAEAQARAKAVETAAERTAQLEDEALETARIADARARAAAADRKTAKEREEQAAADARAAELEHQAAQERKAAAEADRVAAAEAQAIETRTIAEARKAAAEADKRAAETERAAAETRRAAAEADRRAAQEQQRQEAVLVETQRARQAIADAEKAAAEARLAAAEITRRAVEAEDAANLTARQRRVRVVARMVLDAAPADVPLEAIEKRLNVVASTASTTKADALALIQAGYDPARGHDPEAPSRAGTEAN